MTALKYFAICASVVPISIFAQEENNYSQNIEIREYIENILINRTGSVSFDRRKDVRVVGIKTGCTGDTVKADVKINTVQTETQEKMSIITVTYTGNYVRQGWGMPCVTVSPHLNGVENRKLSGTFSFKLTPRLYKNPVISDEKFSNMGEVGSPTHDSNVLAKIAVQNIIKSTFQ